MHQIFRNLDCDVGGDQGRPFTWVQRHRNHHRSTTERSNIDLLILSHANATKKEKENEWGELAWSALKHLTFNLRVGMFPTFDSIEYHTQRSVSSFNLLIIWCPFTYLTSSEWARIDRTLARNRSVVVLEPPKLLSAFLLSSVPQSVTQSLGSVYNTGSVHNTGSVRSAQYHVQLDLEFNLDQYRPLLPMIKKLFQQQILSRLSLLSEEKDEFVSALTWSTNIQHNTRQNLMPRKILLIFYDGRTIHSKELCKIVEQAKRDLFYVFLFEHTKIKRDMREMQTQFHKILKLCDMMLYLASPTDISSISMMYMAFTYNIPVCCWWPSLKKSSHLPFLWSVYNGILFSNLEKWYSCAYAMALNLDFFHPRLLLSPTKNQLTSLVTLPTPPPHTPR